MTAIYLCGTKGCANQVCGIYCVRCRASRPVALTPETARYNPGDTVRIMYRGLVKEGIIEKVMRTNVVVLIQVNDGTKEKLVTVGVEELLEKEAA